MREDISLISCESQSKYQDRRYDPPETLQKVNDFIVDLLSNTTVRMIDWNHFNSRMGFILENRL